MSYNFYTPVAFSQFLLVNTPMRVFIMNSAVVLFRTDQGVFAYEDFCPHRGLALSEGFINRGQLHCKYHGWSFNCENGENTFVPVKNAALSCKLKHLFVQEEYGIIWLSRFKEALIPALSMDTPSIILQGNIKALLTNTLENFLEGSHTHYVHEGLIRSHSKKRQLINAHLINSDCGFKVQYESEPAKGIVTKLLPKHIRQLNAVSTYIHPNIAILEFFNPKQQMVARFEAILKEESPEEVKYLARIFLAVGWLTSMITPLAKMMFKKIISQDKKILELQEKNLASFKTNSFISDETDIIGIYLYKWKHQENHLLAEEVKFHVFW